MSPYFGWQSLPAWIAILNFVSALFLCFGLYYIRQHRISAHKRCMITAFAASVLFLAVYVTHHLHSGIVYYTGHGGERTLYLWLLGTHTVLASIVPFLAVITLALALRRRFARHRAWAHWTWPMWMYVSVSGIAVYWMLYR